MFEVEACPGTYALLLLSSARKLIPIGRLGLLALRPGFYIYVGSALGPGGVRARLAHHFRLAAHPHWHIDYLRRQVEIADVWCSYHVSREHVWARRLASLHACTVPLARFGASDCHCASHLFFFGNRLPLPRAIESSEKIKHYARNGRAGTLVRNSAATRTS